MRFRGRASEPEVVQPSRRVHAMTLADAERLALLAYWRNCEPLDRAFDAEQLDTADDAPEAWRIEASPPDHPGRFVARLIVDGEPANAVLLHSSLEGARGVVPPGLERIPPIPGEPAHVVETWL